MDNWISLELKFKSQYKRIWDLHTYCIQELERFRLLSQEVASHINTKYQILQSEHEQQMSQAQGLVDNMEHQANLTVSELSSQLMFAHNRLTQEAISYSNLENAVQYESNMALQENKNVNKLHVELQEQGRQFPIEI